jgi:inner membrane protein
LASLFSHAAAALAIGACFYRPGVPKRVWALGAFAAMLPDADVLAFKLGIPYQHVLGHRGLTHSLLFAAALAAVLVLAAFRSGVPGMSRATLCLYLFLAAASHGALDALTNGGLGVAFLAPFDDRRFFFPFHPIQVSPIGIARFFSARGWAVIRSELVWVWLPSALLAAGALAVQMSLARLRQGPARREKGPRHFRR